MINSRLIKVLNTFSNNEFKLFGKFINSSFFNSNKNLSALYLFLKKHYPDFKFTSEEVFQYIYPGKRYYNAKIRQLFSEMYRLCEIFLSYSLIKSDPFIMKYHLLMQLDRKKADSLFLYNAGKTEKEFDSSEFSNEYFEKRAEFEEAKIGFYLNRGRQDKILPGVYKRSLYHINSVFKLMLEDLTDISNLEESYGRLQNTNLLRILLGMTDLEGFSDWMDENMDDDYIFTAIHCNLLLMLLFPENTSYYFKSKKVIMANLKKLNDNMKKGFVNDMINYCTLKGYDMVFIKEAFEWNKIRLPFAKSDYYNSGIYFSPIFYISTVLNSLQLKETAWTEDFIKNETQYIHPGERENNRNLAMAYLTFEKKEFEESLKYLGKVEFSVPTIKLNYRTLILQVYYELDMTEQCFSAIDSLNHFIRGSKEISTRTKQILQPFVNIINRLMKLKEQDNKTDDASIIKLKSEIEKAPIPRKRWFFEKLDELNPSYNSLSY